MTDDEIRNRIRTMLRTGDLNCDDPQRLWAGNGSGLHCAGCVQAIAAHEVEYEAQLGGRTVHFHVRCHRIWLQECATEPRSGAVR